MAVTDWAVLPGVTQGIIYYRRSGPLVNVRGTGLSFSGSDWKTLGTLPAGFRPTYGSLEVAGGGLGHHHTRVTVSINTAGLIQAYATTNITEFAFNAVFM